MANTTESLSSKPTQTSSHQSYKIFTANDQWIIISFALLYIATLATEILPALQRYELNQSDHLVVLLIFCSPLTYLFFHPSIRGRRELHPITLDQTSLRCPVKIGSRRYIRIPYEAIIALDSRGSGKGSFHLIKINDRSIHLPLVCFENKETWQDLINRLVQKIAELPDGSKKISRFMLQNRIAHSIFSKLPKFTISLALTIGLIFIFQSLLQKTDLHRLVDLGANSSILLAQGDFFRLITSSLLHAGSLHFAMNLIGLLTLGFIVEGCLGPLRSALIFFTSVLLGTLSSALSGAVLSVGSSAGIFGLLGAFGVINLRFYHSLPIGISMSPRWWIIVGSLNLILPTLIPKIDQAAHIGGLLAGGALTYLMLRREEIEAKPALLKRWERYALTLILSLLAIAALQYILFRQNHTLRKQANFAVLEELLHSKSTTPATVEYFASRLITLKEEDRQILKLTESAINKALKNDQERQSLWISLAELYNYTNRHQAALDILHKLIRASEEHSGSQLFLLKLIFDYSSKTTLQPISPIDPSNKVMIFAESAEQRTLILIDQIRGEFSPKQLTQTQGCEDFSPESSLKILSILEPYEVSTDEPQHNKCIQIPRSWPNH